MHSPNRFRLVAATQQDRVVQSDPEPDKKAGIATTSKIPPALDQYMGRRIAQTMHYSGAEWLIRNEREREERCSLMLANLGIQAGHDDL